MNKFKLCKKIIIFYITNKTIKDDAIYNNCGLSNFEKNHQLKIVYLNSKYVYVKQLFDVL